MEIGNVGNRGWQKNSKPWRRFVFHLSDWVVKCEHGDSLCRLHKCTLDKLPQAELERHLVKGSVVGIDRLVLAHLYGAMAERHDLP